MMKGNTSNTKSSDPVQPNPFTKYVNAPYSSPSPGSIFPFASSNHGPPTATTTTTSDAPGVDPGSYFPSILPSSIARSSSGVPELPPSLSSSLSYQAADQSISGHQLAAASSSMSIRTHEESGWQKSSFLDAQPHFDASEAFDLMAVGKALKNSTKAEEKDGLKAKSLPVILKHLDKLCNVEVDGEVGKGIADILDFLRTHHAPKHGADQMGDVSVRSREGGISLEKGQREVQNAQAEVRGAIQKWFPSFQSN